MDEVLHLIPPPLSLGPLDVFLPAVFIVTGPWGRRSPVLPLLPWPGHHLPLPVYCFLAPHPPIPPEVVTHIVVPTPQCLHDGQDTEGGHLPQVEGLPGDKMVNDVGSSKVEAEKLKRPE